MQTFEDGRIKKQKLLVVDDNSINRKILCNILKDNYETVQAQNGREALEILNEQCDSLSLVLLDIVMPVMSGYEFLDATRDDKILSSIPVIAITSAVDGDNELECLERGATDFVTKPVNAQVVKHRVASILRLRENAKLVNTLKYDSLTGLYTKELFYRNVNDYILENPDKEYSIVCTDIENFKLINEMYGTKKGDELLKHIANRLYQFKGTLGVYGRIGADVFAFLIERENMYSQEDFADRISYVLIDAPILNVSLKCGVYEITDASVSVSAMCDRAILALREIKHKYGVYFAKYDDNIRKNLLKEQLIVETMERSLTDNSFKVYLQPKHNAITNEISGAEALIRWIHPDLGFMPPNDFIPLFETNGFISRLDYFVWEEVCKLLNKWIKEGKPVVPISVNASRTDFNSPNLVKTIVQLTDKYSVPHELLHLELTESAYTDNPQHIISVVEELRNLDFKIEMDDFGSGYSSLNMLSELPLDILKLDMRFLQHNDDKNRIISFIISLAKWLDFPTIAEGVETEEEAQLLRSMGCNYIQGYLFAKPMPVGDFEAYMNTYKGIVNSIDKTANSSLDFDELPDSEKKNALIIEDVEVSRNVLEFMLSPQYHVTTANNGLQALDFLNSTDIKIDVILLDLMMPVMDGFQFMEKLNESPQLKGIPVVVTTEMHTNGQVRALRLGAHGFVAKPYQKEILFHEVRSAIDSAELEKLRKLISEKQ